MNWHLGKKKDTIQGHTLKRLRAQMYLCARSDILHTTGTMLIAHRPFLTSLTAYMHRDP